VGYGVRVKSLGPLVTEWYPANLPAVTTVAGRAGDVLLSHTDITDWATALNGFAPLNSPSFTGTPAAPTPAPASNSTQIATTAFVANALLSYAPLASPAFSGVPTAPTAAPGTATTQLATTAYVAGSFASYAPLNSPAFTGVPTAPTAGVGNNSNELATTAFVANAIVASTTGVASFNTRTGAVTLTNADVVAVLAPAGTVPLMDGVAAAGSSGAWARADHVHPSDTNVNIDCGVY
jgi:hypothetical protein